MADYTISSISILIYLGEIFHYKPSIVTAFLAGSFIGR
jgi:hypothetical protein